MVSVREGYWPKIRSLSALGISLKNDCLWDGGSCPVSWLYRQAPRITGPISCQKCRRYEYGIPSGPGDESLHDSNVRVRSSSVSPSLSDAASRWFIGVMCLKISSLILSCSGTVS